MNTGRILIGVVVLVGIVGLGVAYAATLTDSNTGSDLAGPASESPSPTERPSETATEPPTVSPTDEPSPTPVSDTETAQPIATQLDVVILENEISAAINERIREELGSEPKLDRMARAHARDMAEHGYVGHVEPDGTTLADRYDAANMSCLLSTGQRGAEHLMSISPNTTTERALAQTIVERWLNDEEVRRSVSAFYWSEQGIGVGLGDDGTVYVVQVLC